MLLGISVRFSSKSIVFKKRLAWTGKKLETFPPIKKPVSNESCLLHGPILPFKLSYFWASIIFLAVAPQTDEKIILARTIAKFITV